MFESEFLRIQLRVITDNREPSGGAEIPVCLNHWEGNNFAQTEMSVPRENSCLTKH